MNQLSLMFEIAPRLADAYCVKNDFLTVIRFRSSAEGRQRLIDWLFSVELMELTEFHDCTKAYRNWFQEILNAMDVPWTNGYIEGCNNKTKVLKRTCYGMRNFNNFRKNPFLQYIKIVPELQLRHNLNLFYFSSTPTIDIEPTKNGSLRIEAPFLIAFSSDKGQWR